MTIVQIIMMFSHELLGPKNNCVHKWLSPNNTCTFATVVCASGTLIVQIITRTERSLGYQMNQYKDTLRKYISTLIIFITYY